jgi:hypothetical protein
MENHHYNLLNKLMRLVAKLPRKLRKKIVKGIRDDKFNE